MTLRHSSGMISEAKRRRLEKHRRNYMGRIHSNVFLYFSTTRFSLSLSLSLLLSLSLSFFVPHDRSFLVFGMSPSFRFTFVVLLFLSWLSRDREPRYARFASAPWTIICCFRSRGTIFNRSPLYDRFMCRIEQLTEIKTGTS